MYMLIQYWVVHTDIFSKFKRCTGWIQSWIHVQVEF